MLSIIIPLRNESLSLKNLRDSLINEIKNLNCEIILINDFSNDNTYDIGMKIAQEDSNFKIFNNDNKGLGGAINLGITMSSGDYIAIMMADLSDDIEDLKNYYKIIREKNVDAVFGSRFIKGSVVKNYPKKKLILNRIFNSLVKFLFWSEYNDFTNAFKIYKKVSLEKCKPFVSENFNIFLELPLKIISRGFNFEIIPIKWTTRKIGQSNFKINELSSKYLFTLLYCFLEKILIIKKN